MSLALGQGRNLQFGVIDISAVGDTTLVSAVSGKKIKVVSLYLTISSNIDIILRSGSNPISGLISLSNTATSVLKLLGAPTSHVLETEINEDLIINTSTSSRIGGHFCYFLEGSVSYL